MITKIRNGKIVDEDIARFQETENKTERLRTLAYNAIEYLMIEHEMSLSDLCKELGTSEPELERFNLIDKE